MIVGKLVQSAAKGIKETLTKIGLLGDEYTPEQFRAACQEYIAAHGALKSYARYEAPGDVTGTMKNIAARPTRPLRGPYTLRKSPWI